MANLIKKALSKESSEVSKVEELRKEVQRLRGLVKERTAGGASTKSGYLHKFRGGAESSLWASPWVTRFAVVHGEQLLFWRNEREMHLPPRSVVDLHGASVASEGLKKRRYWTVRVRSAAGHTLVRFSTDLRADAAGWVRAIEAAGATRESSAGELPWGAEPGAVPSGSNGSAESYDSSDSANDSYSSSEESVEGGAATKDDGSEVEGRSPERRLGTAALAGRSPHSRLQDSGAGLSPDGSRAAALSEESRGRDVGISPIGGGAYVAAGDDAAAAGGPSAPDGPSRSSARRRHRRGGSALGDGDASGEVPRAPCETEPRRRTSPRHPRGEGGGKGEGGKQPHPHRGMLPSAPVSRGFKASLLSGDGVQVADQSGVVTLVMLVLAATHSRLILENMMRNGIVFNPLAWVRRFFSSTSLFFCWPVLGTCICLAVAIERLLERGLAKEKELDRASKKKEEEEELGRATREEREGEDLGRTSRKEGADGARGRKDARKLRAQARAVRVGTEHLALVLHGANALGVLAIPSAILTVTKAEPLPGSVVMLFGCVIFLKLVSYAHVNYDLRYARRERVTRPGERGGGAEAPTIGGGTPFPALRYPENLTQTNIWYFMFSPTLCYQLSYPRTRRFRLRWLLKKFAMLMVTSALLALIFEQYMIPTIGESIDPLSEMNWIGLGSSVLRLSLPTLYLWLCGFYAVFDLWLNVLAEITGFGDREFYREWWNATTLGEYWRLWNIPVHRWMLRHVYYPAIRAGFSKPTAGIVSFFISAVFHELAVGVPLHVLRLWSFWGILAQVPLIILTEWLKKRLNSDRIGNAIFWLTFCFFGQPLSIILYYHDYKKKHDLPAIRG